LSTQEIADKLCLGTETIKTHMRHIMRKLSVSDRTQAAIKAMRQGIV
jgi:DNA-binding NarL/FixJ family response regulator